MAAFTGKITAVPVYNAKGKKTGTKDVTAWSAAWYHLDRLGSVVAISDASGSVLEQYRYDPFGKPWVLAPKSAADPSPVWKGLGSSRYGNAKLFTGRDYDATTKTYWFRARTYSPSLGRFLQRDPLGYADGANPYAYVANGPWGATDPAGLYAKHLVRGVVTGLVVTAVIGSTIVALPAVLAAAGFSAATAATAGSVAAAALGTAACLPTVQLTGECAVALAPTIDGTAVCLVPAVTAGAACLAPPVGAAVSAAGFGVAHWAAGQKAQRSEAKSQEGGSSKGSGNPPPNLSPEGSGRSGAFNKAKEDLGIPRSQQPSKVTENTNKQGKVVPGRAYEFEVPGTTKRVIIRDDAAGHVFPDPLQNRGPHFNGPKGPDGNVPHYNY